MKKIVSALVLFILTASVTVSVVHAKEQQCYTHIKKWHACPIQPSN